MSALRSLAAALRRHDRLCAPLLGASAVLGFAPHGLWPLTLLSLAGLFALCAEQSWRRAALLGWLWGAAQFAFGIYWVFISTHVYGGAPAWLGVLLCAVLFGYMALYPALALGLAARLRLFARPAGALGVPALWLLTELLRAHIYSGFPWLSLGYVFTDTPLARLAPVTGVFGLSALAALIAWALYRLVARRTPLLALVLLLAPLACLRLPMPSQWTQPLGAPLRAAIIQGDIPQDQKWLDDMRLPTLERYRDMTLAADDAQLIVWPEVALTDTYEDLRDDYFADLDARLKQRGSALFAGIMTTSVDGKNYYNSVVALGAASGRYDKRHLVPFGEYFPIPDWLRPLMDVLGTPYSDFGFGAPQQAPIIVDNRIAGVAICFEDVFPDEYRRSARDSALMVSVTNDAWFGHSEAAAQHLEMARMRAIESGREVLRASNTGESAIIDADGRLRARAGFYTLATLRGTVQARTGETPYDRWGNAPLWWWAVLLVLGVTVMRGRRE